MADFYWRQPSGGNWKDLQNWRTTSTGSISPSSLPTINDNIYFDDGSLLTEGLGLTDIILTSTVNLKSVYFLTNKPLRLSTDLSEADSTMARVMNLTATNFEDIQRNFDFLKKIFIDTKNITLNFNCNITTLDTLIPEFPEITNEFTQRIKRIPLLKISGTINKIKFMGNIELPQTQFVLDFTGTNAYLYTDSNIIFKVGRFSWGRAITESNPVLIKQSLVCPLGSSPIKIEINSLESLYGTSTVKKGTNIYLTNSETHFPMPIIIKNNGSEEIVVEVARSQNNLFGLYDVQYFGEGGTGSFRFNNSGSVYIRIENLKLYGKDPDKDILEISLSQNYPYVYQNFIAENMSIKSSAMGTTRASFGFGVEETVIPTYGCNFGSIVVMPTNKSINAYDGMELSTSSIQSTRINFIPLSGQHTEVETLTIFGPIIASAKKEMIEVRIIKSVFGQIKNNISISSKAKKTIQSTIDQINTLAEAIGQSSGGTIVDVSSNFGNIKTSANEKISFIGIRSAQTNVETIMSNVKTFLEIPAKANFYDINTRAYCISKIKRQVEVFSSVGAINVNVNGSLINSFYSPVKIDLDFIDPQIFLNFNPTHLHNDGREVH